MTGATDWVPSNLPESIAVAVQEVIAQARSLGLVWTLRLATVVEVSPVLIVYDGDTTENVVTATSMIPVVANQRVYVIITPPAGSFIVGSAVPLPGRLGQTVGFTFATAAGSTASATPVAMPGPPAAAITKSYGAETRLRFQFAGTFFGVGGDAGASFYVRETTTGETVQVASLQAANNTNGTRQSVAGASLAAVNSPARRYLWEGYWARTTGVGTLTVSTDDVWALTIDEIPMQ